MLSDHGQMSEPDFKSQTLSSGKINAKSPGRVDMDEIEADLYKNLKKEQENRKSPEKPSQKQIKLKMRKEI